MNGPYFSHRDIAVTPSTFCRAKCRHCFYSVAERRADPFSRRVMNQLARELPFGIRTVALSGGEPFERPRRMAELVEGFSAHRRTVIVVTNGLWIRDPRKGAQMLSRLVRAGAGRLTLSVDEYHRPRLRREQIAQIIELCRNFGLPLGVQGIGMRAFDHLGPLFETQLAALPSWRMSLRNLGMAEKLPADKLHEDDGVACPDAQTPSVEPDGRVFACCTIFKKEIREGPLLLGRIGARPLKAMLTDAAADVRLATIAVRGPAALYELLGDDAGADWARTDPCPACIALSNDPDKQQGLVRVLGEAKEFKKSIAAVHLMRQSLSGGVHAKP